MPSASSSDAVAAPRAGDRPGAVAAAVRIELLRDALEKCGEVRIRAHGGSMWPWLRPGDELSVRRAHIHQIAPGQVVLYARDGRLFAHRVLRRVPSAGTLQLIVKGDALPCADAPVSAEELLGRVVARRRGHRETSLDSVPQVALGRLCLLLTRASPFWYPLAAAAGRALRSFRR